MLNTRTMIFVLHLPVQRWLGSRVVSVLDSGAERPGFKSQPRRCRVTVLGTLFTPIVLLFTKQQQRSANEAANEKGKGSPYSITERRVPELIPVLGSQPAR